MAKVKQKIILEKVEKNLLRAMTLAWIAARQKEVCFLLSPSSIAFFFLLLQFLYLLTSTNLINGMILNHIKLLGFNVK